MVAFTRKQLEAKVASLEKEVFRSIVDTVLKRGCKPLPALTFALNVAAWKKDFMASCG